MHAVIAAHRAMREIRELIDVRGMRHGRAVRRAFPAASDGDVQAIARALKEGVELVFSDEQPEFVRAYEDVHSCMAGMGDLIYRAYRPARVWVAALELQGVVVARALMCAGRYCQAYGRAHFALDALLRATGFIQTEHWLDGEVVAVVDIHVPASTIPARVSSGARAVEYSILNPNGRESLNERYPGAFVLYSQHERAWVAVLETPRVIEPARVIPAGSYEWAPYVDGAKGFKFVNEMEAA